MLTFKTFIIEATDGKLTHLTHTEDTLFNGHAHTAIQALKDVHEKIQGGNNNTTVSTKYDGAPSIVYGHHPETGKFFVATKSAFNVNPKINYSENDIDKNHGHAPGLANKLKTALQHLPKITPKKGVFQGDMMHTKSDMSIEGGKVNFTPNTITYKTSRQSEEGRKAQRSEMGIVTHTEYKGSTIDNMRAAPISNNPLGTHRDVHQIDPAINFKDVKHTPETKSSFQTHITKADKQLKTQPQEFHNAIQHHAAHLETYINSTVRDQSTPSTAGYKKFLTNKGQKEVDSVKTPKAKEQKQSISNDRLEHVNANKQHFDNAFQIHSHIQHAKNALVDALSNSSSFEHEIAGQKTKPEGFVASHNGNMLKLVDRSEFSRQNLLAGGIKKTKEVQK